LFDLDVTICGRTNHYSFVHNGKKVKLIPNQPKPLTPEKKVDKGKGKVDALAHEKKSDKGKHKMVMNLISHDQIERSLNEGLTCYAPVAREVEPKTRTQIPEYIKPILKEFSEVIQKISQVSCPRCETFNTLLT